jgi:hypothetical protein
LAYFAFKLPQIHENANTYGQRSNGHTESYKNGAKVVEVKGMAYPKSGCNGKDKSKQADKKAFPTRCFNHLVDGYLQAGNNDQEKNAQIRNDLQFFGANNKI